MNKNTITNEKYLEQLKDKNIKVYPLEPYIKNTVKILHKCICGNEWKVSPNSVLNNSTCGCLRRFSNEQYIKLLADKNIKVIPLEKYYTMETKIKHKCTCGNIWDISPVNVLAGQCCGCKKIGHNIETYKNKKTILYYVNVNNMWKIGLSLFTRQTIEENILKKRFGKDVKNGVKNKDFKNRNI